MADAVFVFVGQAGCTIGFDLAARLSHLVSPCRIICLARSTIRILTCAPGCSIAACAEPGSWSDQIGEQIWGNWTAVSQCVLGYYVSGINIGFMPLQGAGDNEAVSGFAMRCRAWATNFAAATYDMVLQSPSNGSSWLGWRECSAPRGFTTSAQIRIQSDQGVGDDTGAKWGGFFLCFGVSFSYQTSRFSHERRILYVYTGTLHSVVLCNAGAVHYGMCSQLHPGQVCQLHHVHCQLNL
jgi:hypothetical protein